MINNLPVKTLKHGDLTIEGYSRAAVQTYWRFPELKLGFDLGAQPWSFMGTETWFVTHGHLDHIVGAARVRGAAADDEDGAADHLHAGGNHRADAENSAAVSRELDRGRMPCELEADCRRATRSSFRANYIVTAVPTQHTVPSVGFVVWDRRRKLKPEYQEPKRRQDPRHAAGRQRSDARRSGDRFWPTWATPRPGGLDDYPAMYEAKVLICELTFVAPDHRRDKIHKFGHMHLDDIVERRDRFKNELIIAAI